MDDASWNTRQRVGAVIGVISLIALIVVILSLYVIWPGDWYLLELVIVFVGLLTAWVLLR